MQPPSAGEERVRRRGIPAWAAVPVIAVVIGAGLRAFDRGDDSADAPIETEPPFEEVIFGPAPIADVPGSWVRVESPTTAPNIVASPNHQILVGTDEAVAVLDVASGVSVTVGRPEFADLTPSAVIGDHLILRYDRGPNVGRFAALPLLQLTSARPALLTGVVDIAPGPNPETALVKDDGALERGWHQESLSWLIERRAHLPHEPNRYVPDVDIVRRAGPISPNGQWKVSMASVGAGSAVSVANERTGDVVRFELDSEAELGAAQWTELDVVGEVRRDTSVITRFDVFVDDSS